MYAFDNVILIITFGRLIEWRLGGSLHSEDSVEMRVDERVFFELAFEPP